MDRQNRFISDKLPVHTNPTTSKTPFTQKPYVVCYVLYYVGFCRTDCGVNHETLNVSICQKMILSFENPLSSLSYPLF
jgi:hypothetical protein